MLGSSPDSTQWPTPRYVGFLSWLLPHSDRWPLVTPGSSPDSPTVTDNPLVTPGFSTARGPPSTARRLQHRKTATERQEAEVKRTKATMVAELLSLSPSTLSSAPCSSKLTSSFCQKCLFALKCVVVVAVVVMDCFGNSLVQEWLRIVVEVERASSSFSFSLSLISLLSTDR